ncbi:MAG: response regulator [Candidatus Riflebacteria bacterium]|nr:response regulator [Candidatus Riflebacteria bacterium]
MNKVTVLVVDDDVDFVKANQTALENAGFKVLTAYSGTEGMQMARENHVDVAILDVIMETADRGFTLAREMRNEEKTKSIPLVMLTSVNEVNQKAGFLFTFSDKDRDDSWLPIDKFLDKPVKPKELVDVVNRLMGEGSKASENFSS